ncbi:homocysteine S-methyltransferase 1-like [Trichogramma pretiosum]|uniref:homocysteine S-methyltransferase 1-like n=1 Tax=Trichogramma pretiosum TaxID=7493 RepID=UPI0006C9E519|nr:homocysteine S-methyltransferase 1-like [Trichogramma pretiosum]
MSTDVKVIDGGFSTQLAVHVGDTIDGDPLWTSKFLCTNPDAVYSTHLDFLKAGANIIETCTYQASIPGFVDHLKLSQQDSADLIKKAVVLAKKAVSDYKKTINLDSVVSNKEPLVAGSVGPYAAYLHDCSEYTGGSYAKNENMDSIVEWHKPRLEILISSGVDLLAIETIPCAREAQALVEYLKQYPDTRYWLSFSCKDDGKSIADGSNFQETVLSCYKSALPGQLIACGVNCLAPTSVSPLLKSISKENTGFFIPMIAYPNSGEIYSSATYSWSMDKDFHGPEEFVKEWIELGVRYIGGCCRTGAQSIERISALVQNWKKGLQSMV